MHGHSLFFQVHDLFGFFFDFINKDIQSLIQFGGLIGGIATSWLIGPAWELKSTTRLGRKVLVDKAPIFSLPGTKRASQ